MSPKRGGFTLIELLVVITIIGILIGLMFPIYTTAIRSVQEATCQDNISQLAKVISAYCQANDGYFPFATGSTVGSNVSDWLYVAQSVTNNLISNTTVSSQGRAGDMQEGLLLKNKLVGKLEAFYCPTDMDLGLVRGTLGVREDGSPNLPSTVLNYYIYPVTTVRRPATSYVINSCIGYGNSTTTPFGDSKRHIRKFSDFPASTFLFIEESSGDTDHGEQPSTCRQAYMGAEDTNRALTARHRGGGYVACMDGHVEWMMHDASPDNPNDPSTFVASRNYVTTEKSRQGKTAWYYVTGTRWGP